MTGNIPEAIPRPTPKIISDLQKDRLAPDPNQLYMFAVPSHLRGVSRSSQARGGMRWTRMALLTRVPDADGEVVWS